MEQSNNILQQPPSLSRHLQESITDDDGDQDDEMIEIENKVQTVQNFLFNHPHYIPTSSDLIAMFDDNNNNNISTNNDHRSLNYHCNNVSTSQFQIAAMLLEHIHRRQNSIISSMASTTTMAETMATKRLFDRFINSMTGFYCTTPLVAAINAENESVVKLLLDHGAIPQESRRSSRDATTFVSCVGGLRYDSYDDEDNNNNNSSRHRQRRKAMTPLMHAARLGHAGITKLLLDAIMSETTTTTRMEWCNSNNNSDDDGNYEDVTQQLFCPISDVYDEQAKNALMHACSEGHVDVVRLLIDYAVQFKRMMMMMNQQQRQQHQYFVKNNCHDCPSIDDETNTAEDIWKRKYASKIVNSYKVDTALWYACGHGHTDVVRLLVDCGALPEYRADGTIYSSTPLMEASEWGHLGVVKLLLSQDGTDPRSATGRKAARLASEPGYTSVVTEMEIWTKRLNGLDSMLKSRQHDIPTPHHSSSCKEKTPTTDQNNMRPKPGLLPFVFEQTKERRTMLFRLIRENSEIITANIS
jgi:ankyrin repeat protein